MPLSPEVVAARINVRICELRVIAASTFVQLAHRHILVGPDAYAAERNIHNIAADMLKSYAEYHAMAAAQRGPRQ